MKLDLEKVQEELKKIIGDISSKRGIKTSITGDTCPHDIGIKSPVLISVMVVLGDILNVDIPEDSYIFHDKPNKQLTIKEASIKLMNILE